MKLASEVREQERLVLWHTNTVTIVEVCFLTGLCLELIRGYSKAFIKIDSIVLSQFTALPPYCHYERKIVSVFKQLTLWYDCPIECVEIDLLDVWIQSSDLLRDVSHIFLWPESQTDVQVL